MLGCTTFFYTAHAFPIQLRLVKRYRQVYLKSRENTPSKNPENANLYDISHASIHTQLCSQLFTTYRKTFNISLTLVGHKIVDYSDVVGTSPVGAAPTTSSFSTSHMASMDWAKAVARGD